MICGNVGDSRAIMVEEQYDLLYQSKSYVPRMLSKDHKPGRLEEKARILSMGGRIEKLLDEGEEIGIDRVWLPNENIPGLAMSRSFGDFVAKSIGVISEPEMFECEITPACKFAVIATDGLWDVMSNERVIEIVGTYYKLNDVNRATSKLLEESFETWERDEGAVDDITIIVIFF